MKVKFMNGSIKECSAPSEQKLYKAGVSAGWIVTFRLLGEITSHELDELFTEENIFSLDFLSETKTLFTLSNYRKTTSAIIRHDENTADTYAEIHLTKGV